MKRMKVAVVGCGHLGAIHARLLAARADAELVAVVDPLPESRDRIAAGFIEYHRNDDATALAGFDFNAQIA
jgi:predicted dehydrogenase